MSAENLPRSKSSLAHTAFALSSLIGDRICGILPAPGQEVDDEAVEAVLDDVDQVRFAIGELIDGLRAEYPSFAQEYAEHEARMRAATDRWLYARSLLRLAGDDPDAGEQEGGAE